MEPERLIEKCSTIFIAAGDQLHVFHSLEEVPDELRKKLLETTRGAGAATILIADQRGREEILRAAETSQSELDRRLAAVMAAPRAAAPGRTAPWNARWIRLLSLAAALACVLWAALAGRA
jgi:hypothetical protein